MDPLTVLNTLWRHKWTAVPVLILTIAACAYVYLFAPRTYEASMSYALAAPDVPSQFELQQNKDLAKLNSDNPYLRTGDSSLLSQVVIAKLSDPEIAESLEAEGLGADYTIAPIANLGMGLVQITASAGSDEAAVGTAQALGEKFKSTIKSVQEVNHADSSYLYSAIPVRGPGPAQELYSSRLRSLIMVGIAGAVLLFGVVSVAQSFSIRKDRRTPSENAVDEGDDGASYTSSEERRRSSGTVVEDGGGEPAEASHAAQGARGAPNGPDFIGSGPRFGRRASGG